MSLIRTLGFPPPPGGHEPGGGKGGPSPPPFPYKDMSNESGTAEPHAA